MLNIPICQRFTVLFAICQQVLCPERKTQTKPPFFSSDFFVLIRTLFSQHSFYLYVNIDNFQWLICFFRASGLTFFLSITFQPGLKYFYIIAIFFQLGIRVEISTRDENVHIISPLVEIGMENRKIEMHLTS